VTDLYSPAEIAQAAGVREHDVLACMSGGRIASSARTGAATGPLHVAHAEAVRIGAALVLARRAAASRPADALFSIFSDTAHDLGSRRVFAVSSTVHATILAVVVFIATFNLVPRAAMLTRDEKPSDMMRLIFLATPGPGGGGGGGGLRQPAPPPKAMREGHHPISSPVPPAKPIAPAPASEEPLKAEPLPALIAPIVNSPSDTKNRVGVLEQTAADNDAHGPGVGGGAGTGSGTGLGQGTGPGVGPGSGGGIGGGPYRPGSGIEPPRLLREVKADYTEEARQRGISGEVVMEIVVRRDGSIGDIKILQGLGGGLNDRAVQAVRQWRFAPAQRQGVPVDVIVEVAVEFKLR
jgi:periplasmic protein TonB